LSFGSKSRGAFFSFSPKKSPQIDLNFDAFVSLNNSFPRSEIACLAAASHSGFGMCNPAAINEFLG
jgi:hypothetical protein